eukprot:3578917-Prymnesium_polylepis.1
MLLWTSLGQQRDLPFTTLDNIFWAWVIALVVDEINQWADDLEHQVSHWTTWNKIDAISYTLFMAALFFRIDAYFSCSETVSADEGLDVSNARALRSTGQATGGGDLGEPDMFTNTLAAYRGCKPLFLAWYLKSIAAALCCMRVFGYAALLPPRFSPRSMLEKHRFFLTDWPPLVRLRTFMCDNVWLPEVNIEPLGELIQTLLDLQDTIGLFSVVTIGVLLSSCMMFRGMMPAVD